MKKIFLLFVFSLLTSIFTKAIIPNPDRDIVVIGHVVSNNEHVPFASISIKGTSLGTVTDIDGHYRLANLPAGTYTIVASMVGYKPNKQVISVVEGEELKVNFSLEEDVIELNQVVVSANRTEINRTEASTIVNTITPLLLESTNSVSLSDGLSYQPGLRVETNCQNCGFQQVRINGLDGPYSQILIDSRAIFSALSGVYGIEQIPASMIERVEVVRGGGSALFGSNAIAGTINIITKEPLNNSFKISTNHSFINKNSIDNSFNANTSLITKNQKGGILLFGSLRDRDIYDANNDGFSEISLLENATFGFRAYYKPTAYSKIITEYHNLNEFRRGGDHLDLQPHEANIAEQLDHNIHSGGITYNLFSKNYKSKISVYASMQSTARKSYYGAEQDINAYGHTDDLAFVAGLQFIYNFDKFLFAPSTLTSGIEYQLNDLHDVMQGYGRDLEQNVNIWGMFAQNEWQYGKFKFLLGTRIDKHSLLDAPILSPRANILYKASDFVTARASYSQGFRAPQAFDEDLHILAVGGDAMLIQLADDLETEKSNSYSGSLNFNFSVFGLSSNVLVEGFYTKLSNVFVVEELGRDADNNLIMERRNGSGAEVYGTTIETRVALSKKLQLQAGFTAQKSRYTETQSWSDENNAATKNMFRTPDFYGYFNLTGNPFSTTRISLSGIYTGSMYVPHYAGSIENDVLTKSDDFFELNIKVSHNFKIGKELQLQINGGVKNIANSYQSDFDIGASRDAGYIYGPSNPRTIFVGLKIGTNL